jgi:hypothetical protein
VSQPARRSHRLCISKLLRSLGSINHHRTTVSGEGEQIVARLLQLVSWGVPTAATLRVNVGEAGGSEAMIGIALVACSITLGLRIHPNASRNGGAGGGDAGEGVLLTRLQKRHRHPSRSA